MIDIKYNIEIVKGLYKNKGFELIDDEYINGSTKMKLRDAEGYIYFSRFYDFNNGNMPMRYNISNGLTHNNMNNFIKLNKIPTKILKFDIKKIDEKLLFLCECGKEFRRCWNNFSKNKATLCLECSTRLVHKNQKHSYEYIKEELFKRGYNLITSIYTGVSQKLHIVDVNGYEYLTTFNSINDGVNPNMWDKSNPYSVKNISLYLRLNTTLTLVSTVYESATTPMKFRCNCGSIFELDINRLCNRVKPMCIECVRLSVSADTRTDIGYIKKEFENVGFTILEGGYKNNKSKLTICDRDGYKFYTSYNRLTSHGCNLPIATTTNPYSLDNIKLYLNINKIPLKVLSDEYISDDVEIKFECGCGEVFFKKISQIKYTKRYQCSKCQKSTSSLEHLTEMWLIDNKIKYKKEYRFDDCRNVNPLPFDFAIFKDNDDVIGLVEADGAQHFEDTRFYSYNENGLEYRLRNDEIKDNYCKNNNIPLLRIPYWEFKYSTYEDLLENFLL